MSTVRLAEPLSVHSPAANNITLEIEERECRRRRERLEVCHWKWSNVLYGQTLTQRQNSVSSTHIFLRVYIPTYLYVCEYIYIRNAADKFLMENFLPPMTLKLRGQMSTQSNQTGYQQLEAIRCHTTRINSTISCCNCRWVCVLFVFRWWCFIFE